MENSLIQDLNLLKKLPDYWQILSFSEVIQDVSGGNIKTQKNDFKINGSIPVIDQGKEFIAGYTDQQDAEVKATAPYIVFGDHTRILKYVDFKFAMGADGTKVLKIRKGVKATEKYIYYFFKTLNIPETGYNRHFKYLKDSVIPLPDLPTQQKVAALLDKADELRQYNKQLIEKYDELTQSLFLDMFGDPVKNEKGWDTKTVGEVCSKIMGGGTPSKSNPLFYVGEIPWVTPKDMKSLIINDSIDKISINAVNNSSAKLIPKNAILMVIRSGILKRKLPVAINTTEVTINQDMKAFIPKSKLVTVEYLLNFFINVQGFLLTKVRAVTADNIEFKQIKELSIAVPPIEMQYQFTNQILLIEQQKEQAQQALQKSEDLFNSLLQKAFKGDLIPEYEF